MAHPKFHRQHTDSEVDAHFTQQQRLERMAIKKAHSRPFEEFMSTAEHHKCRDEDRDKFFGPYAHIRKQLDYSFHHNYKKQRQWLQDSILDEFLVPPPPLLAAMSSDTSSSSGSSIDTSTRSSSQSLHDNSTPVTPWLIYTVGAPGAGKHHTLMHLIETGRLPLLSYVAVDQHAIRRKLPEFSLYCDQAGPDKVDRLTAREAGYIMEIMILAAVQAGRNVVVDGALQDPTWNRAFLDRLHQEYADQHLKIALLHITAPRELILQRAAKVAMTTTGRFLPEDKIDRIMEQIPKSMSIVQDVVDFVCEISNAGHYHRDDDETEITLLTQGMTWSKFHDTFVQELISPGDVTEEERKARTEAALSKVHKFMCSLFPKTKMRKPFDATLSSEVNHKADEPGHFYGAYSHIRATLDYSYHEHYSFGRQVLQDRIIADMLHHTLITDVNGDVCTTPTEPWIVFTAGAMGAGKGYVMNKLVETGRFPLLAFVIVDPDEIRQYLPEFHLYVKQSPELAGELTRKEAGFIAEILTLAGLQAGKNVLVDGSLRDYKWYQKYLHQLRDEFPVLRQAIIHVTAPRDAVFQRAASRALQTGRVVPKATLEMALEQVPRSVKILRPHVDYFAEMNNAPNAQDVELVVAETTTIKRKEDVDDDEKPKPTWQSFERNWLQTCAWIPRKTLTPSTSIHSTNGNTTNDNNGDLSSGENEDHQPAASE